MTEAQKAVQAAEELRRKLYRIARSEDTVEAWKAAAEATIAAAEARHGRIQLH